MKQTINIGSVANDGLGDPLRTAFTKTNENFTELYGYTSNFVFVQAASDLPDAVNGVITLADNVTYYFTDIVDLAGNRLVCGANTVLIGGSSENCGITSTGLSGSALLNSSYSLPIRHLQLSAEQIFNLDASGNAGQALDWYGVNLLNTSQIGTIANYSNFVVNSMAFLSASGLIFDGTMGTISLTNTLFTASSGAIITLSATATISRRFRITYSSFVTAATALDVNTSASIPVEGYILDTVNFSGGGTYTAGVQYSDNKALFVNNKGINNSTALAEYYMQDNAVASDIITQGVAVKIAGTTLTSLLEKFTHSNNRATYTGALVRNFKVVATVTLTAGNNQTIGLYIAKNGDLIESSEQYVTTSSGGRVESVAVLSLVSLSTNDYIELYTENASATTDVTVSYMNVTITPLN